MKTSKSMSVNHERLKPCKQKKKTEILISSGFYEERDMMSIYDTCVISHHPKETALCDKTVVETVR